MTRQALDQFYVRATSGLRLVDPPRPVVDGHQGFLDLEDSEVREPDYPGYVMGAELPAYMPRSVPESIPEELPTGPTRSVRMQTDW